MTLTHAGRTATLAAILISGLFTAIPAGHAEGTGEQAREQARVQAAPPNPTSCPDRVALINASFEQPVVTNAAGWDLFPDSSQKQLPNWVAGWLTSASDHRIEIWKSGFSGVPSADGNQFAELNANLVSTLYQDLPTTPGTKLYWGLSHRGRAGQDTMALDIGAPGAAVEQARMTDGTSAWGRYSGTYTVPAGQTTTRFAFRSISSAGGSQAVGNFLDGIFFGTPPCVVLTKTAIPGGAVEVGDVVTYRLTAKNHGGASADNVKLSDAIPAGTTYVPGSLRVVDGPNSGPKTDQAGDDQAFFDSSADKVTFHLGNGATGAQPGTLPTTAQAPDGTTVEFRVKVELSSAGGQISNQGTVAYDNLLGSAPEPLVSTSNDMLTTVKPAADLRVVKSADLIKVSVGQTVTYRVTVTNDGPNGATGVTVHDALPANLTFISADPSAGTYNPVTETWTIAQLAKDATATLTIRAKATAAGETVNTADVHGNETDLDPADNTDTVKICVDPEPCEGCQAEKRD